MTDLNKLLKWLALGLPFPLIVLNGWLAFCVFHYFQALITIFVTAILFAFVLNYPVDLLQQRGLKRDRAVLFVCLVALLSLGSFAIVLAPILLKQFNELADSLPTWIDSGNQKLQILSDWAVAHRLPINIGSLDDEFMERLPNDLDQITTQAVDFALGTISNISEGIFAIVLGLYLLVDGKTFWQRLVRWMPAGTNVNILESLRANFESYFVGQAIIAVILAGLMTVAFLLLKVPFALLFGLTVGIVSFFPFGDTASYVVIGLLMASYNFWLGVKVVPIMILIDQIVDNGISPRILGNVTGLRPFWILAALLTGASLGGLLGLFVAVPIASSIKSIIDGLNQPPEEPALEASPYSELANLASGKINMASPKE